MQTQGIMLSFVSGKAISARSENTAKSEGFADAMTKVQSKDTPQNSVKGKMESKQEFTDNKKLSLAEKQDEPTTVIPQEQVKQDELIPEEAMQVISQFVAQTMDMLKELFSLSEEELTDLMEQMGISVMDFAGIMPGTEIVLDSTSFETLKQFVLNVHGIEDAAALLTNPELAEQFAQLTEGIQNLLEGQVEDVSPKRWMELLQKLPQELQKQVDESVQTAEPELTQKTLSSNIAVQVEQNQMDGEEQSFQQETQLTSKDGQSASAETQHATAEQTAHSFVERINEAFQKVVGAKADVPVKAADIVQQVVHQIKVRVMPETTSMELTLNPESLGKVNIEVSQTRGVSTAVITVQNDMAKEAMESQLITLKETFAEKGLKVESVEVNVSEFGFSKDGEGKNQENQTKNGKRRFRMDVGEEEEFTQKTEEARVGDSVIDYTA